MMIFPKAKIVFVMGVMVSDDYALRCDDGCSES